MNLSSLIKRRWIIIVILALMSVEPARLSAWIFSQQALQAESLAALVPSAQAVKMQQSADLNGDGIPECLNLWSDQLQITNCAGTLLWQSPENWQVKEAQIGDLNRDGKPEVILLVWRPFQPWPIDKFLPSGGRISAFHDLDGKSCHIILIGWARDGYNELWGGSALIRPVSQINVVDLDGDSRQELVTLEGLYDGENIGGQLTVWNWNGFGFTLADQSKNYFHKLKIIGTATQKWILVQK